jgi:hypothetical protein
VLALAARPDLMGLVLFAVAGGDDPLVRVTGSATCPLSRDVTAHLERVLPSRPKDVAPDDARVDADPAGVRVELRTASGVLVGEKTFVLAASCAEMAEAIGVVLATWAWPLHPGLVPPVELGADPASRAATRATAAPPAAATIAVAPAPGRFRVEIGAGAAGLLPGPVPGLSMDAVVRHRSTGWGGRLSLAGSGWYAADLDVGRVAWTRLVLGVGVVQGWQRGRWFLDVQEQLLGALLLAAGQGYDETRRPLAFDPGVAVGVRAGLVVGRAVRLWGEAGVAWWPIPRALGVEGVSPQAEVAAFQPSLALGASFLTSR